MNTQLMNLLNGEIISIVFFVREGRYGCNIWAPDGEYTGLGATPGEALDRAVSMQMNKHMRKRATKSLVRE